jgi:phage terminase large subunit-like protein
LNLTPADQYIKDVLDGTRIENHWVKLAVQRHVDDLEHGHKRGLIFDPVAASFVLKFFTLLKHHKGTHANQPIKLEPHQQFYLSCLFGWKRKDGTRRFRTAYKEVSRKNGKTTEGGGKLDYHIILDREIGAQAYCAATKEDQATIAVNDAYGLVKSVPSFTKILDFKIHAGQCKRIIYPGNNSFIAPIGKDSKTQDGLDVSYAHIDEYHEHPTDSIVNVLESGMAARRQPLMDIITTAGYNKNGPCYAKRNSICEILEGKKQDDSTFGIIYTLDKDDDWEDASNWQKANPNLGVSVEPSFMVDRFQKAKNEGGSKEIDFKTKNLNVWCDALEVWIQDHIWMACKIEQFPDLTGRKIYCGLDLASTTDVTCLTLTIPYENRLYQKYYFWLPEDALKTKEGQENDYLSWKQQGFIETTPGNVTDYGYIKNRLREIANEYEIVRIGYDKWNALQLATDLADEGFPMAEFSQAISNMNEPTKNFEKLVLKGEIAHDGNPVMRWMMGNIAIKTDSNGNMKIDKKQSKNKVDGPVSAVMSIGEWMTPEENKEAVVEGW